MEKTLKGEGSYFHHNPNPLCLKELAKHDQLRYSTQLTRKHLHCNLQLKGWEHNHLLLNFTRQFFLFCSNLFQFFCMGPSVHSKNTASSFFFWFALRPHPYTPNCLNFYMGPSVHSKNTSQSFFPLICTSFVRGTRAMCDGCPPICSFLHAYSTWRKYLIRGSKKSPGGILPCWLLSLP